ncbi:MAG: tetratricopeptide repeat protein [Microgenomates group bacterium]
MKNIFKYYVRAMMLVLPISFLPIVVDSFGLGKNWILMVGALVGILLWGINVAVDKEREIKVNNVWWILGMMVVVAWLGWWMRLSPGVKMRSVTDFGGVGTLSAWWLWLFIWLQTETDRKQQLNWLTAAGLIAGVLSLGLFLWPVSKLPIVWPKDNPLVNIAAGWSIAGSLLNEVLLMLFLVVEWGKRLTDRLRGEQDYIKEAVVIAVLSLVLMLGAFRMYKTGWVNLDGRTSWVVAVEALKTSPIWGVGAGNFSEAFFSWRPVSYNLTKYWANGFKFASNGILNLWTELGLVGLGLGVLMGIKIWGQKKDFEGWRLIGWGLSVVLLPVNFVTIWLMMWLLAGIESKSKKIELGVAVAENKVDVAIWAVEIFLLLVIGGGGYWMYRIISGEIYMRQSMVAAAKNDGGGTYNLQIKAIGMLPMMAEYRRVYSQTNLSLASVLLANKEMTDEDKQKASVLVQQAVREGKSAIALEGNNSSYWLNLASIYRQIVGVVDGSADWSFQAYQQAVALEPANPVSRLEMGGLLFAAGRYDEADRVFEAVVMSKNDFANAWYNWAYTAYKLNRLPDAVDRLAQAVALVPADSGDFEKANKELMDWKKQLEELTKKVAAQQAAKQAETLETPKPLPTGKAVIPAPSGELNPPAAVVSPEPTKEITN